MEPVRLTARVSVECGDLTKASVDALVNAANSTLLGGGGVDGAIHRAGGPVIQSACQRLRQTRYPNGLPTGEAVITPGGRLSAPWVIHTVGPVYHEHKPSDAARLLANCYRSVIDLAASRGFHSLAIPAISTGVFGFPREQAAEIVSSVLQERLAREEVGRIIQLIRLIFFTESDAHVFLSHQHLAQFTPP
ncbi:O-acetyl-ADP-ribose deacetylase [Pokkaliibacter sp. CJK22405]|uniref:O-acetyl-ADP-ribose deacetylase n=1 Tax=Pokkaliibacter sp. CJK22405 TaxID=3384615 RepID=UPI0039852D50